MVNVAFPVDTPYTQGMRKTIIPALALGAAAAAIFLTGCTSDADVVSENISTASEQFEVMRRVTVLHPITSAVTFEVEGRCSMESAHSKLEGYTEVTCKIGPNEYMKHYIADGDNGQTIMQQLETVDASNYHHRVIIKPENALPEFDYEGGEQ